MADLILENNNIKLIASNIENTKSYVSFDVVLKNDKKIICQICTENEDLINGRFELKINIIEKNEAVIDAIKMFIEYIFYSFPIHKLVYKTLECEKYVLKIMSEIGFKIEAELKNDSYADEKYQDKIILGLLRN